jgi:hypothetical protein
MEDDMVADAVLWALFAAAIAFITFGCHCTRRRPQNTEEPFEHTKLDRAA